MKTIRALTFNMQHGQLWDPVTPDSAPLDLSRTVAELQRLDADILFLQEVERVTPEQGQIQPPPNFAQLQKAFPDYHGIFTYPPPDPGELPFGYGQAIFAKTPLSPVQTTVLPAADLTFDFFGEPTRPTARILLETTTEIHGQTLTLLNVHLQAYFMLKQTSDKFSGQRDVVAARLAATDGPTLLAGDLNAAPDEGTLAQFKEVGFATAQTSCVTWKRMPFVLDHLLYNAPLKCEHVEVHATEVSDHEILMAEFSL